MAVEIPRFLTTAQGDLVRETEPARMAKLDEDDLLDLHTRVRRARSKYVKLYRQTGQRGSGSRAPAAMPARERRERRQGRGVRAGPGQGRAPASTSSPAPRRRS